MSKSRVGMSLIITSHDCLSTCMSSPTHPVNTDARMHAVDESCSVDKQRMFADLLIYRKIPICRWKLATERLPTQALVEIHEWYIANYWPINSHLSAEYGLILLQHAFPRSPAWDILGSVTALTWQKEASDERLFFFVNEQNVSVILYIDINAISWYLDLNIFQQDERFCSKRELKIEQC